MVKHGEKFTCTNIDNEHSHVDGDEDDDEEHESIRSFVFSQFSIRNRFFNLNEKQKHYQMNYGIESVTTNDFVTLCLIFKANM
jgi:hypothetical protein